MNALDVPLVFVPGNHDPDLSGYRRQPGGPDAAGRAARPGAVAGRRRQRRRPVVDVAGLRIGGPRRLPALQRRAPTSTPSASRHGEPCGCAPRRGGAGRARGGGVDVLLTHAPPRGVGDGDDPAHRGFSALHGLVRALRPADAAARARAPLRDAHRARPGCAAHGGPQRDRLAPARDPARGPRLDRNSRVRIRTAAGSARCPLSTGFPRADVENDFLRVRRRQVLARLVQRLRRAPDDVNVILPLDEVVAALGRRGERRLGLQTIRLDTHRRHGRLQPRLRPAVPPDQRPGAGALGAARAGAAARRVDPADRRVPGRRPVLRRRTVTTGCRSRWPPAPRRSTRT